MDESRIQNFVTSSSSAPFPLFGICSLADNRYSALLSVVSFTEAGAQRGKAEIFQHSLWWIINLTVKCIIEEQRAKNNQESFGEERSYALDIKINCKAKVIKTARSGEGIDKFTNTIK